MDLKQVGSTIRQARIAKGLTQQKIANSIKICRASLIDLEYGRSIPKWDKMVKLQKLLGIKIKI